jgi:hypothetical protein
VSLAIHQLEHRRTRRLCTDPYTGFGEDGNGWEIVNWVRDLGGEAWGREDGLYIKHADRPGEIWLALGDRVALRGNRDFYRLQPDVYAEEFDDLGPVPS